MSSSAATLAQIRAIPDFAGTPPSDATINLALEDAAGVIGGSGAWGDVYSLAHRLYACHLLAVDGVGAGASSGGKGAVKSRTVGPVTETYATGGESASSSGGDGALDSTRFGRQFRSISRSRGVHAVVF